MLFRCHWYFIIYLCSISFIFSTQFQNSQLQNILKQLIVHKQNPSLSCLLLKTLVFLSRNHLRVGPSQLRSPSPTASRRNAPRLRWARTQPGNGEATCPSPQSNAGEKTEQEVARRFGVALAMQQTPPAAKPNPGDVSGGLTSSGSARQTLSQPPSVLRLQAAGIGHECEVKLFFSPANARGPVGRAPQRFDPPTVKTPLSTEAPQSFPQMKTSVQAPALSKGTRERLGLPRQRGKGRTARETCLSQM